MSEMTAMCSSCNLYFIPSLMFTPLAARRGRGQRVEGRVEMLLDNHLPKLPGRLGDRFRNESMGS